MYLPFYRKKCNWLLVNPIYWPGRVYGIPEERYSHILGHSKMLFLLPASSQLPTWKELTHFSRLNPHICSSLKFSYICIYVGIHIYLLLATVPTAPWDLCEVGCFIYLQYLPSLCRYWRLHSVSENDAALTLSLLSQSYSGPIPPPRK